MLCISPKKKEEEEEEEVEEAKEHKREEPEEKEEGEEKKEEEEGKGKEGEEEEEEKEDEKKKKKNKKKKKKREKRQRKKKKRAHLCLQDLELVTGGPEVGLGHRPPLGGLAHLNQALLPLLLQPLRTLLQPRHLIISSLHEENKDRQLAAEEGGE